MRNPCCLEVAMPVSTNEIPLCPPVILFCSGCTGMPAVVSSVPLPPDARAKG